MTVKRIEIPEGVTSILGASFYKCYMLEKFFIPKNVISISSNPFFRASSLKEITVDKKNEYFADSDGVLYDKQMTTLIAYPEGKQNDKYIIPKSVTTITGSAFGYHPDVKKVTIFSSVTNFPEENMFIYPDDITLIVEKNSNAEQYALKHNLKFEYI